MLAKPVCVLTDGRTAADRGWNSWLAFGCSGDNMTGSLTAQIVTETADAMVSTGLKDKGYEYVNLYVALRSCCAFFSCAQLFLPLDPLS